MACLNKEPCELRGSKACVTCKFYLPSQHSKYYRCRRYLESRVTCSLPKSACRTCTHHLPKGEKGRPPDSGIDWTNKADRNKYMREYRIKNAKINQQP